MKKILLHIIPLFILLFIACQQDNAPESADGKGKVCVTFTLNTPQVPHGSRSISDDPKNGKGTWTDWERLIDGRYLYRVTLLIVDGNNQLAAYKDWDLSNSTTTTEVSETFKDLDANTTYTMYAVANYSAITANNHTYNGLSSFPTLTELTVGTNISNTLITLQTYKLEAGTDCICPQQPQPLTLIQEFTTPANGDLAVSGELVRTYARIRIEVYNKSTSDALKINSLRFSNAFAQQTTSLFPQADVATATASSTLDIDAEDALTPFTTSISIDTLSSKVVFDAYVLESKSDVADSYTYTLALEYPGKGISYTTTEYNRVPNTNTGYTTVNDISENYNNNYYYLIKNTRSGKYIYVNTAEDNKLYQGSLSDNITDYITYKEYLWILERQTNNRQTYYYFKNLGTGRYIGAAPGGSNPFPTTENQSVKFQLFKLNNNSYPGIQLYDATSTNQSYRYMNDNSSNFICSYSNNDDGNGFYFYPVQSVTTNHEIEATYSTPIILKTIGETGTATSVSQISRNDFINVVVNVAYNTNTGNFEFHVDDWSPVNNEITYE